MVDYQLNLEGWLEDVTLFPTEQNGYNFNLDDLLDYEKVNNEVPLSVDLPDLEWLDEKIDLNFFEDPKSLLLQPNDAETLMLEDAASLLLNLVENNSDTSCLPSSGSKAELNNDFDARTSEILQFPVASPLSTVSPSPYYESISAASSPASIFSDVLVDSTSYQLCLSPEAVSTHSNVDGVNLDASYVKSEASSPASIFSDVLVDSTSYQLCQSPGAVSTNSIVDGVNPDVSPVVSVTVCNTDTISDHIKVEETMTIEEVTSSVKERKYVSNGNRVPKVQVSLKNVFHPYSKSTSRRKGDRNERKKVQNKEAASRYRMKKRNEEKELSDEVSGLEAQQKELQTKHDDLFTEIKYLKSLMREMLQKKGVL